MGEMDSQNKTPKSQLKWQKEYDKKNMKSTGIKHTLKERALFDEFAEKNNLPLSNCIRRCVLYCIENNIDIESYIPKLMKSEE